MVDTGLILALLVNGIVIGGVYGLMSVGLSFTWKTINLPNSAQAAFTILAAFISYWLLVIFHVSPFLFVIPMGMLFLIGMGLRRFLFKKMRESSAQMIFLMGYILALVLESGMTLFWGSSPTTITLSFSYVSLQILGITIPLIRLVTFIISVAVFIFFGLFLKYTMIGKTMRAVGENRNASTLVGINVERTSDIVAGIGAILAGIAGPLLGMIYAFNPASQETWIGTIFAVVMLAGLDNIYLTLAAGILLGSLETVVALFLPSLVSYALDYIVLIAVLLVRFRK
ncbi:MAG: branched-chain amino acid ABC transporter permease [Candidatus Bathyarchaeia archaeon]|jgi:branched-chain amino acid transport system permease protein